MDTPETGTRSLGKQENADMLGTSVKSSPHITTRKQGTDIQFNIGFGTSAHKTLVLYPIKRVSV